MSDAQHSQRRKLLGARPAGAIAKKLRPEQYLGANMNPDKAAELKCQAARAPRATFTH